jgi:hypothetical protein
MPNPITSVDEELKTWATERQCQYIDAVNALGSMRKAAISLGIRGDVVTRSIQGLKVLAAKRGYSPDHDMVRPVPAPFVVKGVSTYYDEDGKVKGQWVKSSLDRAQAEQAVRDFVSHLAADIKGLSRAVAPPKYANSDIMAVYPMGDPHFGMYAWGEESGDDFDLATAERLAYASIDRLVSSAPPAETAMLLNLGDFFHADNSSNMTPTHGVHLDVDTRHAKVMQVGIRSMKHCIDRLLEKHKGVVVWNLPGNHDPHSSFALSLCLAAFFDNQDRVHIDLSPSMFKYHTFGKCLIGAHHGHGAKMEQLPGIMAHDRSEDWGLTKHRYWYCGHIHHRTKDKEHPGVMVETFRTLAPKDSWHAGKGYRAGRDMQLIVLHREHGEIERHRCDIGMIEP